MAGRMAWYKHRPKLRLETPLEIRAGTSFQATAIIDAKHEVPIDGITLRLVGKEKGRVVSGNRYPYNQSVKVLQLDAELSTKRILPKGRTELPCRFDIPAETAPTYLGLAASTSYQLILRAAIPWWADAKASSEITIRAARAGDGTDTPTIFPTDARGPQGKEAYFEASLPTLDLEPGAVLPISVALSNVAYHRYTGLTLVLLGRERVRLKKKVLGKAPQTQGNILRRKSEWNLAEVEEGKAIPLSLKLPEGLPPTFSSRLWAVEWAMELKATVRWGRDISRQIPIRILPIDAAGGTRQQLMAPPDVGSDRIQAIWKSVAEERDLIYEDGVLSATRPDHGAGGGTIALTIRREHRGSKGIFLVAEVAYPALHLDFSVAKAGLLGNIIGLTIDFFGESNADADADDVSRPPPPKHLRIAAKNWNKVHAVSGREEKQLAEFFIPLATALLPLNIVTMDDEKLAIEYRNSGTRRGDLNRFAQQALALTEALPLGRARISAPAAMKDCVPSWESLANTLEGRLELSCMAVRGTRRGHNVWLATHWLNQTKADFTRLTVLLTTAIGSDHTFDYRRPVTGSPDAPKALPPTLPAAAVAGVKQLVAMEALSLHASQSEIQLDLPGGYANALELLPYLDQLISLAETLRPMGGPYR